MALSILIDQTKIYLAYISILYCFYIDYFGTILLWKGPPLSDIKPRGYK